MPWPDCTNHFPAFTQGLAGFFPPPPAPGCSGSLFPIARQTRGSLLPAKHSTVPLLHSGPAAPQNLRGSSAPPALLTDTPQSSSALHSHLAAHSVLPSSPFAVPAPLPRWVTPQLPVMGVGRGAGKLLGLQHFPKSCSSLLMGAGAAPRCAARKE